MDTSTAPSAILGDPQKRRGWVIYRLQLQGQTLAGLAHAHGVTRQCLYHVFKAPYPNMERLLAEAVGMKPQVLFAERYGADGLPARRIGRPKKVSCHEKNDKPNRMKRGKAGRGKRQ